MTYSEAYEITNNYVPNGLYSEDDVFMYTEAMHLRIKEEIDENEKIFLIIHLAEFYYKIKQFDLALKYYELANDMGISTDIQLGKIWYYGRIGKKDYEKAFRCFNKIKSLYSRCMISDMYKNGYYVEQNKDKSNEIIESLYEEILSYNSDFGNDYEVFSRLAMIRKDQGDFDKAIFFFQYSKKQLADSLEYYPLFEDIDMMDVIVQNLYSLTFFDEDNFDLYDLLYLLKNPGKFRFIYNEKEYNIISQKEDDNSVSVYFRGKWYRDYKDFINKAYIDNNLLTTIYKDLDRFSIL